MLPSGLLYFFKTARMPCLFKSHALLPLCCGTPPFIPARRASGDTRYGRGSALGRPAASHCVTHSRISCRGSSTSVGITTVKSPAASFWYESAYTSSLSEKYAPRFTMRQSAGSVVMNVARSIPHSCSNSLPWWSSSTSAKSSPASNAAATARKCETELPMDFNRPIRSRIGALASGSTTVDETGILPRLANVQITSALDGSSASKDSTR
mmetsp:Transcript_3356/g.12479  ORF Transcript_3356/g.12479 Transcript_3356/m.12479 type:complete len:210 (-) Transcript_3356:834-1463(-)